MRFPLDPGDVIGHGCWETIKRLLTPVSSVWIGCFCALVSMFMAGVVELALGGFWNEIGELFIEMAWAMLYAPLALFLSIWSLLVVPVLAYVFYQMIRGERDLTWMWLATTAISGLMVMSSDLMEDMKMGLVIFAWVFFLLVLISLGVGLFFWKGWQQNAQAKHLQEVTAENEMRRMELEQQYGTTSFGQDNLRTMDIPEDVEE